jgi:GntR family transcriptional regulator
VTVAGTPQQGAVLARARELLEFARRNGYRREELIELMETLG